MEKSDHFLTEEALLLSNVPGEDAREIVEQKRAQLKLVENPPTFVEFLAAHGILDQAGLMNIGIAKFCSTDFGSFGKGKSFAGLVLGRSMVGISLSDLDELGKKLELPQMCPDRLIDFRKALIAQGVVDRIHLLNMPLSDVRKLEFPPLGKIKSFITAVLGEFHQSINREVLNRVADELGFPKITLNDYRNALGRHGIIDLLGLMRVGNKRFQRMSFGPFGKGKMFAGMVLGRSLEHIATADLSELGERLNLPQISRFHLHHFKDLLFSYKIYDRKTLRNMELAEFKNLWFSSYGKIVAFASVLLDESGLRLSHELLDRVAMRLRLPEDAKGEIPHIQYTDIYDYRPGGLKQGDEKLDNVLAHLEFLGIYEKNDLFRRGVDWFSMKNFKGFGAGIDLVSIVLGRKIESVTQEDLEEFADRLGFFDHGDFHYEEQGPKGFMFPSDE